MAHQVYLGLGSNSEDATVKLALAQERIANLPDIVPGRVSSLYHTEPQGYADQPWFCNMVMAVTAEQSWEPASLLEHLLAIETELGRVRDANNRFGPRSIDIDLLLFGTLTSNDPLCLLPHPRMSQRAFVLVPLMEIASSICINGVAIGTLLKNITYRLENGLIYQ